jgi:flagellar biosynthesis protein FlhG
MPRPMKRHAHSGSPSRIISVGGGKGGVGKSVVSANLSVALAQAQTGRRVVLVDLDLGAANQHLLLGVSKFMSGVQALIEGEIDDVEEALTPTSVPNLFLLAGSGAVLGAANISYQEKRRLLRKLRQLDAIVVVDVGAGVSYNALDFFLLGEQKLVVTTPQVTAIHDSYSFLKGALLRMVGQQANKEIETAILEPALQSNEGVKVTEVLARLREQRPELADKVALLRQSFGAHLIGNFVTRPSDAGIFWSVTRMIREFLGIEVPVVGLLPTEAVVGDSVNDRRPFMLGPPCELSRIMKRMAEGLVAEDLSAQADLDIEISEEVTDVGLEASLLPIPLAEIAARSGELPAAPGRKDTLPGLTPSRPHP